MANTATPAACTPALAPARAANPSNRCGRSAGGRTNTTPLPPTMTRCGKGGRLLAQWRRWSATGHGSVAWSTLSATSSGGSPGTAPPGAKPPVWPMLSRPLPAGGADDAGHLHGAGCSGHDDGEVHRRGAVWIEHRGAGGAAARPGAALVIEAVQHVSRRDDGERHRYLVAVRLHLPGERPQHLRRCPRAPSPENRNRRGRAASATGIAGGVSA